MTQDGSRKIKCPLLKERNVINLTNSEDAIFHTIQGEGKYIGYPCVFVRLSQCNLRCTWQNKDGSFTICDTPHTSFDPIIEKHSIESVLEKVKKYNTYHVVVSGGEPYFQKSVVKLINGLVDNGHYVTVETNGTIYRESKARYISISPKLHSSSMSTEHGDKHERNRLNYDNLLKFINRHVYQFKFVVNDKLDIIEIDQIVEHLKGLGRDISHNIWLMPQGISDEQFNEKMQWIVEVCKERNWKLTDRLHIRIWGTKKGV